MAGLAAIAAVVPVTCEASDASIIDQHLTFAAFSQLAGQLAGYSFVKVVVDREARAIHFINHAKYQFHADYIAERLLGMTATAIDQNLDSLNKSFYFDPARRFFLGIIALHKREEKSFFSLETVEVDVMDGDMIRAFFRTVREHVDQALPLYFKPANHLQETTLERAADLPVIFSRELFASAQFIALNVGAAKGRLRVFATEEAYRAARATIEWFDIIVMRRVPDDIPRVSGIINAEHTTPLSHTNVLASGWQVPNAIQLGIMEQIAASHLDSQFVEYRVEQHAVAIAIEPIDRPAATLQKPAWSVQKITLEEPETTNTPIGSLAALRTADRFRYGTKAANLGELSHVLNQGSERLLGFYKVKRPPRASLLPYLASYFKTDEEALAEAAFAFLQDNVKIPRGIALPFSLQQEFLTASPAIQQAIGKLKMALELNAQQIDSLCIALQHLIRQAKMPARVRDYIDNQIAKELSGVSSFVIRSSSNAEDLENFSAAGIYESVNHVTTAENVFESIKQVWASLVSPRSVRLRHEVGISLDESYMGVIVQEQIKCGIGGVLVTTNPLNRGDFRNVYLNVSAQSVNAIVQGHGTPYQYLYNTVEMGGRTLSIGSNSDDLSNDNKAMLQKLAVCGRLLQSHFSPNYLFDAPVDIEWLINEDGLYILQLRPFAK